MRQREDEDFDHLHDTGIPERDDKDLERIARFVAERGGHDGVITDERWEGIWRWHTDAYANKMSGGSEYVARAKKVRAALECPLY